MNIVYSMEDKKFFFTSFTAAAAAAAAALEQIHSARIIEQNVNRYSNIESRISV